MGTCIHDVPMNEPCNDQGCCGTQGRLEKLVCHKCEDLMGEVVRLKSFSAGYQYELAQSKLDAIGCRQRAETAEAKLSAVMPVVEVIEKISGSYAQVLENYSTINRLAKQALKAYKDKESDNGRT